MVAILSHSLLNIMHGFVNDSDFLDTLNHTMVYYNYSYSPALYSISSIMMDCAIRMQLQSGLKTGYVMACAIRMQLQSGFK